MKDKSKLTRKTITNKLGHRQSVWVRTEKKLAKKNVGSKSTEKLKKVHDWIEKMNNDYLSNPKSDKWDGGKSKVFKLSPDVDIEAMVHGRYDNEREMLHSRGKNIKAKNPKLSIDLEVYGDYENEVMNLNMKDLPKAMAKLGKQHDEYLGKKKAGQPHYTDYENSLGIIAEHNPDKSEEWVENQLDRAVNNILSRTFQEKDLTEKHYKNLLNAEFGIKPKKYAEHKKTILQDREDEDEIFTHNNPK